LRSSRRRVVAFGHAARLKKRFAATMARAKRYDAQGNRLGCTRELAKAKRMYVL
jgi:hypothetical protein